MNISNFLVSFIAAVTLGLIISFSASSLASSTLEFVLLNYFNQDINQAELNKVLEMVSAVASSLVFFIVGGVTMHAFKVAHTSFDLRSQTQGRLTYPVAYDAQRPRVNFKEHLEYFGLFLIFALGTGVIISYLYPVLIIGSALYSSLGISPPVGKIAPMLLFLGSNVVLVIVILHLFVFAHYKIIKRVFYGKTRLIMHD